MKRARRTSLDRLATVFRALGDPTRLHLLHALLDDELCVHDLATRLGLEQSAASHQLRVLRDQRLVRRRREGRHIYYALDDTHVRDLFTYALEHVQEVHR